MIDTLLITFREGLEAFLIVAITLAYLTKTNRLALIPAVYAGVGVAILLSSYIGYRIGDEAEENPAVEGIMSLVAGFLVASMTLYVMKTATSLRSAISNQLERHAVKPTLGALIGIFGFTVLMIAREGIETAVMLGAISAGSDASSLLIGAISGLVLAASAGVIWVKQSHKINLRLFLQATGVFLILFSIRLFVYGIHEVSEMDMIPYVDNGPIHIATEPFGHDGLPAQILSYGLLAVPCLWLAFTFIKDHFQRTNEAPAAE